MLYSLHLGAARALRALTAKGSTAARCACMGKKELRKRIRHLAQRVQEHREKIQREQARPKPNEGAVRHWEAELKAFLESINRARKRLGEK